MQSTESAWRERYGPWAIVTGASDGIGRAIADQLAQAGLNLLLVARRQAVLDQLATDWRNRYSIKTMALAVDLSQPDAVEQVLSAAQALDVGLLVACAGFGTTGRFMDADPTQELNMLAVNCQAVLLLSQQIGQRLAKRGHGGIILMSSLVAFQGVPLVAFQGVPLAAHYAATKAYVQFLAEGLHEEMAPLGVDVLASSPGPVHSDLARYTAVSLPAPINAWAWLPNQKTSPAQLWRRWDIRPPYAPAGSRAS